MEFDKERGSQVANFSTSDIPGGIIFYRGYPSGVLSRDVLNPVHPASYHFLCTRNRDMGVKFFPTRTYPFTKWIQQFTDETTLVHPKCLLQSGNIHEKTGSQIVVTKICRVMWIVLNSSNVLVLLKMLSLPRGGGRECKKSEYKFWNPPWLRGYFINQLRIVSGIQNLW